MVEFSVVADCCPALPAVAACCDNGVVANEWELGGDEMFGRPEQEEAVSIVESHPAARNEVESAAPSEPTLAGAATVPPNLEPIAAPPALEPAGAVTPASNEQPLAEATGGLAASPPGGESVLAEPEMPAGVEPRGEAPADNPVEPVQTVGEQAADPTAEPPMEDEAEAATAAVEPEPAAETKPAPPVEPEPEAVNIFEELEAEGGSAAIADEEVMTEEPAVDPFGSEPTEPATTSADAAEAAAEPAVSDPFAADEPAVIDGEAMADEVAEADAEPVAEPAASEEAASEEPAASASDPIDPFAGGAGSEEPAAAGGEPAALGDDPADDPFAAVEPLRRWIDASGTGSIVATLLDVTSAGNCVLETRGRQIVVPLEKLSGHDRDYVHRAGVRLAKLRGERQAEETAAAAAAPAPGDTAGL